MRISKIYKDNCPGNPCGQGGIEFDDGSMIIDYHDQDCCENVCASFGNLDSEVKSYNFNKITLKSAKGGFRFGDNRRMFFVPCYNIQNGYYNDALSILYGKPIQKIARYRKGKPIYEYEFIPSFTLSADTQDDIW